MGRAPTMSAEEQRDALTARLFGATLGAFDLLSVMLGLELGYYRSLAAAARSGAPVLLFAIGAIALVVTAMADSGPRAGPKALEAFVHNLSAATAFVCVTTAMLLQSWRFRDDAQWRHRFLVAFTLASACFAALLWHAFWSEGARGLTQKAVIALILCWLGLAAEWLRRGAEAGPLALRDRGNAGGAAT